MLRFDVKMGVMLEKIRLTLSKPLSWRVSVSLLTALAFLFAYPILSANIFYNDDMRRFFDGVGGWAGHGRFVAELLTPITGSGQLLQILSTLLLVVAGLLVLRILAQNKKPNLTLLAVSSLTILNPFILGNIVYRYDSLGMTLGYTLSIAALYILTTRVRFKYVLVALMLILVLGLYQPMINVFVSGLIVLLMWKVHRIEQPNVILRFIYKSLISLVASIAIYMLILKIFPVSSSRQDIIGFNSDGVRFITNQIEKASEILFQIFNTPFLAVAGAFLFILALIGFAIVAKRYLTSTKASFSKRTVFLIYLLSPLLLLIAIPGTLLILKSGIMVPRTLASVGMLFIALVGFAVIATRKSIITTLLVISVLPVSFITYSFFFGAYNQARFEYNENIASHIEQTLISKGLSESNIIITHGRGVFQGPPQLDILEQKIPMLGYAFDYGYTQNWLSFKLKSDGFNVYHKFGSKREKDVRYNAHRELVCRNDTSMVVEQNVLYKIYKEPDMDFYTVLLRSSDNSAAYCPKA